ncbi:MAG: hypothetical protein QM724_13315 [Flavobacteriales bacterium]
MDRQPLKSVPTQWSLCINCLNAPGCVQREAARGQVQYCDLHVVADGPRPRMTAAAWQEQGPPHAALIGLCSTCDHAFSCVLRKPGHMVTHCQHYE